MTNNEKIYAIFTNSEYYTPQGIIKHFKEWTGGWEPNEEDKRTVEKYIKYAILMPISDLLTDYDSFMTYLYGEDNYLNKNNIKFER